MQAINAEEKKMGETQAIEKPEIVIPQGLWQPEGVQIRPYCRQREDNRGNS